jgi:hypothetical protein
METKPKRRWYQFSLRRLMLAVACFAVGCAMWKTASGPESYYDWGFDIRSQILVMFLACFIGGAGLGVLFEKWWVAWVASVVVTLLAIRFLS